MIKYGVIGTGWITSAFIESANTVDGLVLNAVYSRSEEKAAEFAKKHNASNIFTDIDKLAKSDLIDAIYIASPNSLHHSQAKLFLENKKHVICEKPVATSGDKASELINLANKNGVVFMEAIMSMHMPQLPLLKEAFEKIGNISQANINYLQLSSKYPMFQNGELPNIFNPKFETGCVMDIGIYCVYPILHLFGTEIKGKIMSSAVLSDKNIDLCGSSIFPYSDKTVTLSYSKIGDQRSPSEIVGDKGTIVIDQISKLNGIKIIYKDGSEEIIHEYEKDLMAMKYEAKSFLDIIQNYEDSKERLKELNNLTVDVCDVLKEIRNKSGVCF